MTRTAILAATALCLVPASASAQFVDAVARALAKKALAAATAPAVTKTTLVGGDTMATPAVSGGSGTVSSTPVQVNGSTAGTTGYSAFKYGPDGKGIVNTWVKTRGFAMNGYDAVQIGDRVVGDLWQAGTGEQTGHVGGVQVSVDGSAFTPGEVAGRWVLFTGTGISTGQASSQYPNRWGSIDAIVANSFQQVLFPGGVSGAEPAQGANFGGWVVIGAGASSPGFGALKFLTAGAALLATPEAGAFEVDANARPYFTAGDGVRRGVVLADTASPAVRALAGAGSGAAAQIDASGSSGVVTLTTGTGAGGGDLFAVTYAHPYSTASYPVVSAANPAAVALVRGGYLTATAVGFTLSVPAGAGPSAGIAYTITYYAPGR